MIRKEILESLDKSICELYSDDMTLDMVDVEQSASSEYRFIVTSADVNANVHYCIRVKRIPNNDILCVNGWTLKEIRYQRSWNTLNMPYVEVIDPMGTKYTMSCYNCCHNCSPLMMPSPLLLQREICDIPERHATQEDVFNRIVEGMKIFLEISKYPNISMYSLLNDYRQLKNVEDWNRRFVEVYENKSLFSDEQLQSFYCYYVNNIKELYNMLEN